jgi:pimeloyl-ACP methyl ester carboxylesterase
VTVDVRRMFWAVAAAACVSGCMSRENTPTRVQAPQTESFTVALPDAPQIVEAAPLDLPHEAVESIETIETDDAIPTVAATPATGVVPSLDEMILFVPVKLPAADQLQPPAGAEAVWLNAKDGTKLYAWWWPHPQPAAQVLYLHGNSGNLWTCSRYVTWLHDAAACSVLAVDYRGYGYSEGTPTVEGVLQDVRAARAEMCRCAGLPAGREVIIGRSLGGALAVDLAAETPPRGLVLESTFSSFKEVAEFHAGVWAARVPADRLNSRANLPRYPGPLLQVHGDADRVVPFDQGVALHAVAVGQKQFLHIPGRGHSNFLTTDYLSRLQKFLRELP